MFMALIAAAIIDNNFYFAQSQGRFVPSFENPRNGFFPSALQRQQPPPDSYQEQTLFVNSNNVDRGNGANDGAAGSRGITPSYYQFTYTRWRMPDGGNCNELATARLLLHQLNRAVVYCKGALKHFITNS
uniref:Uncharacterized protein n=1 Tax=Anopheles stephensi TaxID=30069 RepID=A0A182YP50_ANOST